MERKTAVSPQSGFSESTGLESIGAATEQGHLVDGHKDVPDYSKTFFLLDKFWKQFYKINSLQMGWNFHWYSIKYINLYTDTGQLILNVLS